VILEGYKKQDTITKQISNYNFQYPNGAQALACWRTSFSLLNKHAKAWTPKLIDN